jgi:hypothetical protein
MDGPSVAPFLRMQAAALGLGIETMTNSEPPFAESFFKLERASGFIRELEANLEAYRASNPAKAVAVDATVSPPTLKIEWAGTGLLPGAIIGDVIHNARTALDLMASELARRSGESDKDVYFPFANASDKLDQVIKNRNFDRAGQDAVKLLKAFKPYRGGNTALRALHDLDVQDKHKMLIVTSKRMNIQVAGSYNIDDPAQSDVAVVKFDVDYLFPEDGETFSGLNVIETLKELVQLVHGIIEAFSRLVELRSATTDQC